MPRIRLRRLQRGAGKLSACEKASAVLRGHRGRATGPQPFRFSCSGLFQVLHFSTLFRIDISRSDVKRFHHLARAVGIGTIDYDLFSFLHPHVVEALRAAGRQGLSVTTSLLEDAL